MLQKHSVTPITTVQMCFIKTFQTDLTRPLNTHSITTITTLHMYFIKTLQADLTTK